MSSQMAIGIDFGTSTSFVAEGRPGRRLVPAPLGETTTYVPSLVGQSAAGFVAGERAADLGAGRFVRSIKRAITQNRTSLTTGDGTVIDVDLAIEAFLRELNRRTQDVGIAMTPESIRLGCPAQWNAQQRDRLLRLAGAAGLPVADHTLIDEPVAAGVAWVRHRVQVHQEYVEGKLLVFDMGGGTLDVAVLQVDGGPGKVPDITVLASMGVAEAGDSLDESLQGVIAERLDLDLSDPATRAASLEEARSAKLRLSEYRQAQVSVATPRVGILQGAIDRLELEDAFRPQLDAALQLVLSAIRMSRLTHVEGSSVSTIMAQPDSKNVAEIDHVLLAGGMTRVPLVAEELGRMFEHAEIHHDAGVPADEVVCAGLADPESYERINLNRPAFNFAVLAEETLHPMYTAYSPLFEPWHVHQRSQVYFESTVTQIKSYGTGYLVVTSPAGAPIRLLAEGVDGDGLPVAHGHRPIRLVIYPNGRVIVHDGRGRQHTFRVDKWPAVRAANHATLLLEAVGNEPAPVPRDIAFNYRFNDGQ